MRTAISPVRRLCELLVLALFVAAALPAGIADAGKKTPGSSSGEGGQGKSDAVSPADPQGGVDEPQHGSSSEAHEATKPTAPAATEPATPTPPAVKAASTPAKPAPAGTQSVAPSDPTKPNLFTERTDQLLKAERAGESNGKAHPLQLQYPDHDVVVCTAGCRPGGEIVQKLHKGRPGRGIVETAEMVPSAATMGMHHAASVRCIAGCYDTPTSYRSVEKPSILVPAVQSSATPEGRAPGVGATADALSGKWTTTVKPEGESGTWMSKINAERGVTPAPAPAASAVVKQQAELPAKNSPSSVVATTAAEVAPPAAEAPAAPPASLADATAKKPSPSPEVPAATVPVTPAVTAKAAAPAQGPAATPAAAPLDTAPVAVGPAKKAVATAEAPAKTSPPASEGPAKKPAVAVEATVKIPAPASEAPAKLPVPSAEAAATSLDAAAKSPAPVSEIIKKPGVAEVAPAKASAPAAEAQSKSPTTSTETTAKTPDAMAKTSPPVSEPAGKKPAVVVDAPAKAPAPVAEAPAKVPAPATEATAKAHDASAKSAPPAAAATVERPVTMDAPAKAPTPAAEAPAKTPEPASEAQTKAPRPSAAAEQAKSAPFQVAARSEAPASVLAGSDAPISVSSEDVDMNSAIAKARGSLGQFWAAYEKPGPGENGFSLKVAISDKGETEHFWLTKIERKGGKLVGTINNKPAAVKSVRLGQSYEFSEDRVSDWLFMRKGKMVGNQTMRPLLSRMPAAEAEAYRAMLETP